QSKVASLSQLVELDEPRAQLRPCRSFLLLEVGDAGARGREVAGDLTSLRGDLPYFLRFNLTLNLHLAQLAEERSLGSAQMLGLAVQRLKAFGRAPCHGFGLCAVGRLRE